MKGFFERQPIETQKTLVALGSQLNATVRELIARYDLKKLEMQFKTCYVSKHYFCSI
jgi:hypothetical protein